LFVLVSSFHIFLFLIRPTCTIPSVSLLELQQMLDNYKEYEREK